MKGSFSFYAAFLERAYSVIYNGQDKKVVIPAEHDGLPVTGITLVSGGGLPGDGCRVKVIRIPASVKEIGEGAFLHVPLEKIIFDDPSGWTTGDAEIPEETLKDPSAAAKFYAWHMKQWKKIED